MKNFWKNVFILCTTLLISALIFPDVDEGIRFTVISICVMVEGIYVMVLFYFYVRKKRGKGEYQRLVERKNIGWRFR